MDHPATEIHLERFSTADAEAVLGWRYAGDFASYDLSSDDESCFADPNSEYLAIRCELELIGFICLGAEARVAGMIEDSELLDVGVGIRPDLVGRGESQHLMPAIVSLLDERTGQIALRAVVKAWNRRAQRAAEHAGFQSSGAHKNAKGSWVLLIRQNG